MLLRMAIHGRGPMKATPAQLIQMERYMIKLLICIMAITAAVAAVPLYMLHEADMTSHIASTPVTQPEGTTLIR